MPMKRRAGLDAEGGKAFVERTWKVRADAEAFRGERV